MPEIKNEALSSSSPDKRPKGRDSVKRSMLKAVSWRVVGTIDTFLLSYLIISFLGPLFGLNFIEDGGNIAQTAGYIAIAEVVTKLIIYTLHEQVWTRINWGLNSSGEKPESLARSTAKTATWRVLASLDTMMLAWFFTGSILTAISIGGFEVITKLFLYFFHERIWLKIPFGTQKA